MRFDDVQPVTVVLIRHGETQMTAGRAMSGSSVPGPSLSSTGRIQAAQAADLTFRIGRGIWPDLPHPSTLVASPMVRTQESAGAVGRRLGLVVGTDDAFAECDFGEWEGLRAEQIETRWPGLLQRWYAEGSVAAPGGESLADVGVRVSGGLQELVAGGAGRSVVVVSHAMAIRAAIGSTLAAPPSAWASSRVVAGSVSIVRWWADGAREVVIAGMPVDLQDTSRRAARGTA